MCTSFVEQRMNLADRIRSNRVYGWKAVANPIRGCE